MTDSILMEVENELREILIHLCRVSEYWKSNSHVPNQEWEHFLFVIETALESVDAVFLSEITVIHSELRHLGLSRIKYTMEQVHTNLDKVLRYSGGAFSDATHAGRRKQKEILFRYIHHVEVAICMMAQMLSQDAEQSLLIRRN
jgi:hypothetical protein